MSDLGTAAPTTIAAGRYQVRGLLGQGGMAAVYRVYDTRLRVECAIKVLAPEYSAKGDLRRRFESEAATMARLRHTNIAAVYDIGDDNGSPYLVMELVGGGSLNDHLNTFGPLPARLAVEVTIAVLTALQLAHDSGVVHRDIKPHNVLLARDGTAKVTDFGIARVQEDDSPSMTRTGSVMGTWAYMAPEQRAGSRTLDRRADLYSAGAMLVDLLTGEAPADVFMCEHQKGMLDGVPEPLRPVIERAVRYAPADRYSTAAEMAAALRDAIPRLPDAPDDHPKLGTLTIATPTLSPSGSAPRAATYSLEDEPEPAASPSTAPSNATLHPGTNTLPGEVRDEDGRRTSPASPAPPSGRLLPALGVAAVLAALAGVGAWLASGDRAEPDVAPPVAVQPAAEGAADPAPTPVVATPPPATNDAAPADLAPPPAANPVKPSTPTAKPVARPAPAPVSAAPPVAVTPPPPAPPAVAPVAPPANATVSVTGDADSVTLVGSAGRFSPGEVPPGAYTIEAAFAGGSAAPAGKITVTAGQAVTVKCVSDFARCK